MTQFKRLFYRVISDERLHAFLDKISLAKPRNQQIAAIALAVIMGLVIVLVISWSWIVAAFTPPAEYRDYRYIPFDELDATMICRDELVSRAGPDLLRSYVDQHSTRIDNKKGVYRVFMIADVGEMNEYREVAVHCFVDKWTSDISHYKEYDNTKKTIMSSDLQFFKD